MRSQPKNKIKGITFALSIISVAAVGAMLLRSHGVAVPSHGGPVPSHETRSYPDALLPVPSHVSPCRPAAPPPCYRAPPLRETRPQSRRSLFARDLAMAPWDMTVAPVFLHSTFSHGEVCGVDVMMPVVQLVRMPVLMLVMIFWDASTMSYQRAKIASRLTCPMSLQACPQ